MDESLEREAYEESNSIFATTGHRYDPDCSCPACEEINDHRDEEAP